MAQFSYKARSRSGEVMQGVLESVDRAGALSKLQRDGLFPVSIQPAKGKAAKGAKTKPEKTPDSAKPIKETSGGGFGFSRKGRKPKLQDSATWMLQLANLLRSGMPLSVALNSMVSISGKGISEEVAGELKQNVTEGKTLSEAMGKHPVIFNEMTINMVRAGEESGALEQVLRRLAKHFERFAEVQSKFVSAMIYPAIVCLVGLVIILFFMTYMLPKFSEIFQSFNATLPKSTQLLMSVGSLAVNPVFWIVLLVVILAATIIIVRYKATPGGRRRLDDAKLRLPVLGKVMRLNLFGQFARTLSTLLNNGVPVLTALKITGDVIPNVIIKDAIVMAREAVTDGKSLAEPLARSGLFPKLMIDLVRIGEDTGDVPGALENVAITYENDLELELRVMTNLIEPAMIIMMAVGVGGLLFSILQALFTITNNIAR
ncbi:MAG: type II secretion system F family protein [Verrucomicrobiota bacterium]|nr:type II secretion system F family protein [Verrucomicrobiota bacterium]